MAKENHTPGPWKVSEVRSHGETPHRDRRSGYSGGIAYIWTDRTYPGGCCIAKAYEESLGGELEANARLIAAAPELYSALLAMLEKFENDVLHNEAGWDAIEAARSAIAKAEGK